MCAKMKIQALDTIKGFRSVRCSLSSLEKRDKKKLSDIREVNKIIRAKKETPSYITLPNFPSISTHFLDEKYFSD